MNVKRLVCVPVKFLLLIFRPRGVSKEFRVKGLCVGARARVRIVTVNLAKSPYRIVNSGGYVVHSKRSVCF